jgi:hypothetical protein
MQAGGQGFESFGLHHSLQIEPNGQESHGELDKIEEYGHTSTEPKALANMTGSGR